MILRTFGVSLCVLAASSAAVTAYDPLVGKQPVAAKEYNAFTGKVTGSKVRLRAEPSLDGYIIRETSTGDLVAVLGEKEEYYAVEPPAGIKGYVFRTYVLDGVIEGSNVNVRLQPNLQSPVICQLNTGDVVEGEVSDQNHKWLEITPPAEARFYIAKDYVEYAGGKHLLAERTARFQQVQKLLSDTRLAAEQELAKPFTDIVLENATLGYRTIISNYSDFPDMLALAQKDLSRIQEAYLHRKVAFLEKKTMVPAKESEEIQEIETVTVFAPVIHHDYQPATSLIEESSPWVSAEQVYYEKWLDNHAPVSMQQYYDQQKAEAVVVTGILEKYDRSVKNKPGDYILRGHDKKPLAYVYSTLVDLDRKAGHAVTLQVVERENNHFAYPAYFVVGVE